MTPPPQDISEPFDPQEVFDSYADDYDAVVNRGLSVSGEDKTYFASGRIAWLAKLLRLRDQSLARSHEKSGLKSILDFGCGTGSATPLFFETLGVEESLGVDISSASLDVAVRRHGFDRAEFCRMDERQPREQFDLAYSSGVFHHISPSERGVAVEYVFRALRPGGWFAFWEHNPWNPGARYVMRRVPFDADAIPVVPPEARRLLRGGGFEIERTDFLFIFPRLLSWWRWLEPPLSRFPLGAQYLVLARKP